jgi:hypothetical protein
LVAAATEKKPDAGVSRWTHKLFHSTKHLFLSLRLK